MPTPSDIDLLRQESFVMEFNAAEREWHEARARLNKMLEDIENSLRR